MNRSEVLGVVVRVVIPLLIGMGLGTLERNRRYRRMGDDIRKTIERSHVQHDNSTAGTGRDIEEGNEKED